MVFVIGPLSIGFVVVVGVVFFIAGAGKETAHNDGSDSRRSARGVGLREAEGSLSEALRGEDLHRQREGLTGRASAAEIVRQRGRREAKVAAELAATEEEPTQDGAWRRMRLMSEASGQPDEGAAAAGQSRARARVGQESSALESVNHLEDEPAARGGKMTHRERAEARLRATASGGQGVAARDARAMLDATEREERE